jgi:hypothetical protein
MIFVLFFFLKYRNAIASSGVQLTGLRKRPSVYLARIFQHKTLFLCVLPNFIPGRGTCELAVKLLVFLGDFAFCFSFSGGGGLVAGASLVRAEVLLPVLQGWDGVSGVGKTLQTRQ